MEKFRPHYLLAEIKSAFVDASRLNRTFTAKQGADNLGLDNQQVVAVIQALTVVDFQKSMTSIADHRIWQDVYKPVHRGGTLYVKFTRDARRSVLLISFKEA
jgi:motility quorum-sensing regulator/GCU-specific mRNA interferase toxin